MAQRAQSLLWDDSLLISFFTCALPSLRPGHAILLQRFVMAALHPGGNMYYYPFGHWFDPLSERKRIQNCSLAPHGLMVGPGVQAQRSLWVTAQPPAASGRGVLDDIYTQACFVESSACFAIAEGAQGTLHWFCFCEVLCEIFFGSCSLILSLFLNWDFPAVSLDCLHLTAQRAAVKAGQDKSKKKSLSSGRKTAEHCTGNLDSELESRAACTKPRHLTPGSTAQTG